MKNITLLLIAVLFSVAGFAQGVSITDICYYDSSEGIIATRSNDSVIRRLANKGFVTTNIEYYDAVGAGDSIYTIGEITLYQQSTNAQVVIAEYPYKIIFGSSASAKAFVAEAINLGYIRRGRYADYEFTSYMEYCGVEDLNVRGNTIIFGYSTL